MNLAFESRINIYLSDLLSQAGLGTHPEYLGEGRKDVLIYHQGLTIVLEGSYDRLDAEKDARRRVEQLAADIAVAVHYPNVFDQNLSELTIKQELLLCRLPVHIILPDDISGTLWEILYRRKIISQPYQAWFEIDINTLASLVKEVAQLIINEEALKLVEVKVEKMIELFVGNLYGQSKSDLIATNIYEILYRLYGFSIGEPKKIKEALFAQATLAILLGCVYYESIRYAHKLPSLRELADKYGSQRAIERATLDILNINYELIFDSVKQLTGVFPSLESSFSQLLDLASEISSRRALLRKDLGGKIYHKVVGAWALRKGLATFYTQITSAYLLLYLAQPKLGKIADFACGSGTLLVAAYSAANYQYRKMLWKSGKDLPPEEIERDFHREFISNCYAYDVLGYALQIATLNLALHSPETPIDELLPSQIIPLGQHEDGFVSLGSLEFARVNPQWNHISERIKKLGLRGSKMSSLLYTSKSGPYDMIVMNPPFSRTTGRGGKEGGGLFGFISDANIRSAVLKDYNELRNTFKIEMDKTACELLKGNPLQIILKDSEFSKYKDIWQAGEGLMFIYLADTQIKKEGKIGFVLPRGFLSGVSWFLARALIAAHYHLEYIVVSYDTNEYNFSESTSLAECMFVAKRRDVPSDKETTKFIMLLKKPSACIDALALANDIIANDNNYFEMGRAKAFVVSASRKELVDNLDNWGRFVFLPELQLVEQMGDYLNGKIIIGKKECQIPMIKFNELIQSIGVDRHRFTDTFRPIVESVPGSYPMIWGGGEEQRLKMVTSPNAWTLPYAKNGRDMFRQKGGTFFVPERIPITNAHITAMISDKKALANIFYSVKFKNETSKRNKAMCMWLNTTWGILSILSDRQETGGGYTSLNMTQWRMLPVLNINQLTDSQIDQLAAIFDTYKNRELARIPKQYKMDRLFDKTRFEIDRDFLKVFGLEVSLDDLTIIYEPLSQALEQWVG